MSDKDMTDVEIKALEKVVNKMAGVKSQQFMQFSIATIAFHSLINDGEQMEYADYLRACVENWPKSAAFRNWRLAERDRLNAPWPEGGEVQASEKVDSQLAQTQGAYKEGGDDGSKVPVEEVASGQSDT